MSGWVRELSQWHRSWLTRIRELLLHIALDSGLSIWTYLACWWQLFVLLGQLAIQFWLLGRANLIIDFFQAQGQIRVLQDAWSLELNRMSRVTQVIRLHWGCLRETFLWPRAVQVNVGFVCNFLLVVKRRRGGWRIIYQNVLLVQQIALNHVICDL